MTRRVPAWSVVAAVVVAVGGVAGLAALGRDNSRAPTAALAPSATSWEAITAAAQGQHVRLWMWGGEAALNDYIDQRAAPAAAAAGVTLERVPIDDTASALGRLVTEADAGTARGAVDLVWVNGKNFDQGKAAGLWRPGWVSTLPNSARLDPADPTLWNDFGVATDGQEMPWSRASFTFAYDPTRVADPPRSFPALLDYARAHPGRVAYPAPPDFTGSAFVRQAVQALGEDQAYALLRQLDPLLWRGGATRPKDESEVEQLFANGQLDLAMSYNPNFVDVAVGRGSFPPTVRPYLFDGGSLSNVSFLALPARAANPEGAMVVANLLLSPELQAAKADLVGIPSVLPPATLDPAGPPPGSPFRLADFGPSLGELPSARVADLDRRWLAELG